MTLNHSHIDQACKLNDRIENTSQHGSVPSDKPGSNLLACPAGATQPDNHVLIDPRRSSVPHCVALLSMSAGEDNLRDDTPGIVWWGKARRSHGAARRIVLLLCGGVALAPAFAQDPGLLDDRVTQQSVASTICRPGYADTVSPPLDEMLDHKDRLLAERGIDADNGTSYALDRRVPIVLGGSPHAPVNLDLLPWSGHAGERRKALLTARLKRCVCAGRISLAQAQAAIAGDWPADYMRFMRLSCEADSTAADDSGT